MLMADDSFEQPFRESVADLPSLGSRIHYSRSADRLRRLLREGPYQLTDLRDRPERFFAAHRILSGFSTQVGPGFGIRFTVQVNLFAGTILALGNEEQVASLLEVQRHGLLGCFCLTECLAGVSSGLVVNTTCTWDPSRQCFLLNCPDGAEKNWISQGLTADLAVVVATVVVGGRPRGAHGFLLRIRGQDGLLVAGVTVHDMGKKTIGDDLDNARICFTDLELPASALLGRYAQMRRNELELQQTNIPTLDMIGQRLYTGRTVIAGSATMFARTLFRTAEVYSDSRRCWRPKGSVALSELPQLAALYAEASRELSRTEALQRQVELQLCQRLRSGALPEALLVEKVACLKVRAVENAISLCFRLQQELGSYSLMAGTGFENLDYLQCCKFAEGDSRILMQKIARDRLQKTPTLSKPSAADGEGRRWPGSGEPSASTTATAFRSTERLSGGGAEQTAAESAESAEARMCGQLATALAADGPRAWGAHWREVDLLAEAVVERAVNEAALTSKL